jgi:hypothetical protein
VNFISISELHADGVATPLSPSVPNAPQPVQIVSNAYHSPNAHGLDWASTRDRAFESVTDGSIDQSSGFDTCCDHSVPGAITDFVGLQYNSEVRFDSITIQLGNQFADGGDWDAPPRIFILKNPVDTGETPPEDDPENWLEIFGFIEENEHVFSELVVPGLGGELRFKLDVEGISAADRTGWGWAVGGVDGNSDADGTPNFVSIAEVWADGVVTTSGLTGDLNDDDVVDRRDVALFASKYGTTNAVFADGDFSDDMIVGLADLALLHSHYGATAEMSPIASAVPEPSSALLAALSFLGLAVGRRRIRR